MKKEPKTKRSHNKRHPVSVPELLIERVEMANEQIEKDETQPDEVVVEASEQVVNPSETIEFDMTCEPEMNVYEEWSEQCERNEKVKSLKYSHFAAFYSYEMFVHSWERVRMNRPKWHWTSPLTMSFWWKMATSFWHNTKQLQLTTEPQHFMMWFCQSTRNRPIFQIKTESSSFRKSMNRLDVCIKSVYLHHFLFHIYRVHCWQFSLNE